MTAPGFIPNFIKINIITDNDKGKTLETSLNIDYIVSISVKGNHAVVTLHNDQVYKTKESFHSIASLIKAAKA